MPIQKEDFLAMKELLEKELEIEMIDLERKQVVEQELQSISVCLKEK